MKFTLFHTSSVLSINPLNWQSEVIIIIIRAHAAEKGELNLEEKVVKWPFNIQ